MSNEKEKVLVALSGGVDSSVCVHLLKEQGYDVVSAVMKMSPLHDKTVDLAKSVADKLGIEITVLDMQKEFEENVINYFTSEYLRGATPNPCVVCNPLVKFKALCNEADRLGIKKIATGHYARTIVGHDGLTYIKRAISLKRDQSYMLYRLPQEIVSRLLFPLGELEKPYVREIAIEKEIPSANAPDSQENCFIEGKDYASYIEARCGKMKTGDFISPDGQICGKHKGILHYTVGQRKGLGIALGKPVFVKEINPENNNIYLAFSGDDTFNEVIINNLTLINNKALENELSVKVKVRSTAEPVDAIISPLENNRARVSFKESQRGVAKGQSLVFYIDNDILLGGGFLE